MNVLFINDNRDVLNFGCRSTSIALHQILSKRAQVVSLGKRIADVPRFSSVFSFLASRSHIVDYLYNRVLPVLAMRALPSFIINRFDWLKPHLKDPLISLEKFNFCCRFDPVLRDVKAKFIAADCVVINGEGSLILGTPTRRDLLFQLFCIELANELNTPVFYVNAMASPCPLTGVDNDLLRICQKTLNKCKNLILRDPESVSFAIENNLNKNVLLSPDALFTWAQRYRDMITNIPRLIDVLSLEVWPEQDGNFSSLAFDKSYVVVSGASLANGEPENARIEFFEKLSKCLLNLDYGIIFFDPDGDSFLKAIATKLNCPYIKPQTNPLSLIALFKYCSVYITGRFHPSIMAYISGARVLHLNSNSHKNTGLRMLLEEPHTNEFDAKKISDLDNLLDNIKDYHGIEYEEKKYLMIAKEISQLYDEEVLCHDK